MNRWVKRTLGDLGIYINGRPFKPEEWSNSGVPIIRIENLNNSNATFNCFEGELEDDYKVDKGDILVSWSASLDAYIWDKGPAALNQHIFKVIPNEEIVDKAFLFFVLKKAMHGLTELVHGATMKHVNRPVFESFEVMLPIDLLHQRQIANQLTKELKEVKKAEEAAREIKKDLIRLQQLTFDGFFKEVEDAPVFEIAAKADTTSGSTPSRGQKNYWAPAEIPWVKTGEIAFAPITKTEEYVSKKALAECSIKLLPVNTVLVAMYGQGKTRGQSAILKVPATINQACFAILPNETWDAEFLQFWLTHSYQSLRNISENRGGNQANLNGTLLNVLEVPAPSIIEQKKLVKKIQIALAEIEEMKSGWSTALDNILTLPNKLLEQAFSAEL